MISLYFLRHCISLFLSPTLADGVSETASILLLFYYMTSRTSNRRQWAKWRFDGNKGKGREFHCISFWIPRVNFHCKMNSLSPFMCLLYLMHFRGVRNECQDLHSSTQTSGEDELRNFYCFKRSFLWRVRFSITPKAWHWQWSAALRVSDWR